MWKTKCIATVPFQPYSNDEKRQNQGQGTRMNTDRFMRELCCQHIFAHNASISIQKPANNLVQKKYPTQIREISPPAKARCAKESPFSPKRRSSPRVYRFSPACFAADAKLQANRVTTETDTCYFFLFAVCWGEGGFEAANVQVCITKYLTT